MRPVIPYLNERREVIVIEFRNKTIEGLVNGALLALSITLALTLPWILYNIGRM